jgi:hypothetical protein
MYIIKDMHRATKRGPQAWFEQEASHKRGPQAWFEKETTIEVKHGRLGGYSSLHTSTSMKMTPEKRGCLVVMHLLSSNPNSRCFQWI